MFFKEVNKILNEATISESASYHDQKKYEHVKMAKHWHEKAIKDIDEDDIGDGHEYYLNKVNHEMMAIKAHEEASKAHQSNAPDAAAKSKLADESTKKTLSF